VRSSRAEFKSQLDALPQTVEGVPHNYLSTILHNFVSKISRIVQDQDADGKDLALRIGEEDARFRTAVLSSIARFGLADHDEKLEERLPKSANDFLIESTWNLL
jgi:hypothetical protein